MKVNPGTLGSREEEDTDVLCGVGNCRPAFLQRLASPRAFLANYCALGILQGAYFTYTVGVMSTLERRYAFESKISGVILIADNLSPIVLSLLIGFYGGSSHRPRLIFGGMLVVVLSCFLSSLPFAIFGAREVLDANMTNALPSREFCTAPGREASLCEASSGFRSSPTFAAVVLLFLANFLNGFGYTAFYTIGTPYLDDNVKKKDSPLYLSTMFALRIFGPSFGFLLSSFTLRFYENPFQDPGFSDKDPRWIGAWWLGFVILGVLLFIFTLPMVLFPRRLPSTKNSKDIHQEKNELPKLKDMPKALKKLASNPILVCHTISVTLQINGFLGYYIFMSKYMESQYRQTAASASMYSGSTSILTMLLGTILGGVIIHRLRPRPRVLTGYMVAAEMFTVLGLFAAMFLGCPSTQMDGVTSNGLATDLCNVDCGCTLRVFEPVCGSDGSTNFFSPCYAGCSGIDEASAPSKLVFSNCTCLNDLGGVSGQATKGYCPFNCNMLVVYIVVLSLSKMISSTAKVGNTLVTLRCIDVEDKNLAIGAMGAVLSVFAFIPYPLVFGALTDAACLVWEEKCGETGNCWLYDGDKFRYYLHGTSAALIFTGVLFEFVVFLLSDRMTDFYSEEEPRKEAPPSISAELSAAEDTNGTSVIPL